MHSFATMLHKFVYLIFLYTSFSFPSLLFAQDSKSCTIHFEGDVLDASSKQALEFANVSIVELKKTTQANEHGYFKFEDICVGVYTISVSHLGSTSANYTINLQGNSHQDFFLNTNAKTLMDVNIVDTKKSDLLNGTNNKIDQRQLDRKAGENLGAILKLIPGVNTLNTGTGISKPVIAGLHSSRIVTINDGVKLEGQQWGSEHAPEIDPNSAGQIQVEKGAGALQYSGEAIGGLIIVKPSPLRTTAGLNGSIAFNMATVNLKGGISGMLEGQFKKTPGLSWSIQGTFSKAGNTKTPTYYLKNTGYQEEDFSAYACYSIKRWKINASYKVYHLHLGIFAGSHIGNLTDLMIAFQANEPIDQDVFRYKIGLPSQQITHQTSAIDFTHQLNALNKIKWAYAFQFNKRQEFDKILGRSIKTPAIEFYLNTHSLDFNWQHNDKSAHYETNLGTSLLIQNNYYAGSYFVPEYNLQSIGLFNIHRITLKQFKLEFGARIDSKWLNVTRMKQTDTHIKNQWIGLSFSLGGLYQFDSHFSGDIQLGSSWRAPNAVELYSEGVHHGAASFEKGNALLKQERVYNSSLSFTYHQGNEYRAEITLYNKYINNYIYLKPRTTPVLTIRGAFPAFDYAQTNANFTGLDLFFSLKLLRNFDLSERLSILYAQDIKHKVFLTLSPPNKLESALGYTLPIHNKVDNVRIAINTSYVGKQNLVEDFQDIIPVPKAYFLVGFEAELHINTKFQPIQIFVDIDNLFNKKYRDYLNRWRYFANEAGTNFSLRVKLPFGSKS